MITVSFYRNHDGLTEQYKVQGHAGDAPEGESIVCAWVSAVTQMALIGLEKKTQHKVLYRTDAEKGILEVTLQSEPDAQSQLLLSTMEETLKQLVEECPKYVRLKEHRR